MRSYLEKGTDCLGEREGNDKGTLEHTTDADAVSLSEAAGVQGSGVGRPAVRLQSRWI